MRYVIFCSLFFGFFFPNLSAADTCQQDLLRYEKLQKKLWKFEHREKRLKRRSARTIADLFANSQDISLLSPKQLREFKKETERFGHRIRKLQRKSRRALARRRIVFERLKRYPSDKTADLRPPFTSEDDVSPLVPGDIDGSLTLDVADALVLLDYLNGIDSLVVHECLGDTNADGIIALDDVFYLLAYLFQAGPPPLLSPLCESLAPEPGSPSQNDDEETPASSPEPSQSPSPTASPMITPSEPPASPSPSSSSTASPSSTPSPSQSATPSSSPTVISTQVPVSPSASASPSPSVDTDEQDPTLYSIVSISVINADTDQVIIPNLETGAEIDLDSLETTRLNFQANTFPSTLGSVTFYFDGNFVRTEGLPPYALFGDVDGDFYPWSATTGVHTIEAQAFSGGAGSGSSAGAYLLNFTIIDSSEVEPTSPPPSGSPSASASPSPMPIAGDGETVAGDELFVDRGEVPPVIPDPIPAFTDEYEIHPDALPQYSHLSPIPACADGKDNDDDGLVDYPADPGCPTPLASMEHSLYEFRLCGDNTCELGEECGTCAADCGSCPLTATTFYISENGSGDCSESSPCNFNSVQASATAGDTVILLPNPGNTPWEKLTFSDDSSLGSPGKPIVYTTDFTNPARVEAIVFHHNSDPYYITIRGLEVVNSESSPHSSGIGGLSGTLSYVHVHGNWVEGIWGTRLSEIEGDGINFSTGPTDTHHILIEDNSVYRVERGINFGNGIEAHNIVAQGNTVGFTVSSGILVNAPYAGAFGHDFGVYGNRVHTQAEPADSEASAGGRYIVYDAPVSSWPHGSCGVIRNAGAYFRNNIFHGCGRTNIMKTYGSTPPGGYKTQITGNLFYDPHNTTALSLTALGDGFKFKNNTIIGSSLPGGSSSLDETYDGALGIAKAKDFAPGGQVEVSGNLVVGRMIIRETNQYYDGFSPEDIGGYGSGAELIDADNIYWSIYYKTGASSGEDWTSMPNSNSVVIVTGGSPNPNPFGGGLFPAVYFEGAQNFFWGGANPAYFELYSYTPYHWQDLSGTYRPMNEGLACNGAINGLEGVPIGTYLLPCY